MNNNLSTKENLIETAANLFETKGYHATGLNEILAESGAPKGSLYYHFPKGKEQLALEAIYLEGEKIKAHVQGSLQSFENPCDAIVSIIEFIAATIDNDQKTKGMTISLIALETYISSDILRNACLDVYASLENLYAEKLMQFGMNKEVACKLGCVISEMIEGGITYSLVRKNGNPLRLIAQQMPKLINM